MNEFFKKNFKYIVLTALVCVPLFSHLGSLPIHLWDESRLTMNAYELHVNRNFIVIHYNDAPDLWNTKPPFLIWCQALLMDIVGPNELAMRLPSAIAALLTCIALMVFSIRYLKNFWVGFIAVIIMITSPGYVSDHGTRTGDYDSMLTLFTTISCLYFFAYSETKKNKYLYFFFLSMAFGVLTKSVAALFFTPAIFIFVLLTKQFYEILKNKHFYFGAGIFLLLTLGYYLLREITAPGYLDAVSMNDLGGRFMAVLENHRHDAWFYYDNFITKRFSPWYLLLPLGFLAGVWSTDVRIQKFSKYLGLLTIVYFLVISSSKTKLEWYDIPLFPLISFLTAIFLHFIFEIIAKMENVNRSLRYNFIPFAFLFIVMLNPYRSTLDKNYLPKPAPGSWEANFYELSYYLRDALRGKHNVKDYEILKEDFNMQLLLYIKLLKEKGVNTKFIYVKDIRPNTFVLVQDENLKKCLVSNFEVDTIEAKGNVVKYKIHDHR